MITTGPDSRALMEYRGRMSAFGGKADMPFCIVYVCLRPKADIPVRLGLDILKSYIVAFPTATHFLWVRLFEDEQAFDTQ